MENENIEKIIIRLTGEHRIAITVDGEEICKFSLFMLYSPTAHLFDSERVFCETDNEATYSIGFDTRPDSECCVEFDADFTTISCFRIWEYEHISDKVRLVNLSELD